MPSKYKGRSDWNKIDAAAPLIVKDYNAFYMGGVDKGNMLRAPNNCDRKWNNWQHWPVFAGNSAGKRACPLLRITRKNSKVAVWETSDPTTLHMTKTLRRKRCWPYLDSDESTPPSKNKEEVFCAKWHSTLKQGGHRPEFILQSGRCELCPHKKRNTSRISCATCAKFTRRNEPLHLRSHVWTSAWHSEVQWKASYYSASLMESPGRQVWRPVVIK